MSRTKYLKGECQHCGGHIEFPVDSIGTVAPCPHCQQETELLLARPAEEPTVSRKTIIWTAAGIVVLVLGLLIPVLGLKHFQSVLERKNQQTTPAESTSSPASSSPSASTNVPQSAPAAEGVATQNDFQVSALTLEKTPGSSLVYAFGTASNVLDRQRFGVRVELDLLNDAGEKIGTARDYRQVLESRAAWRFKALVVESKARTAKLSSIKEEH
jgi:hypothetical protein